MCKPIIDLLLLHREPPLRPSLPLRHLPPLLPVGFDGLRIDEKNENERRKVSDSIKDRGTSKPNHQRSAAATDHYHHPAPCHWQRGILRQRGQLEIDGRTIQAETKTAVLQLHGAAIQQPFWWCLWQRLVLPRPPAELVHQSPQPELRSPPPTPIED